MGMGGCVVFDFDYDGGWEVMSCLIFDFDFDYDYDGGINVNGHHLMEHFM